MDEEIAAIVSLSNGILFRRYRIVRIQVIDNGSGMCKAGCEFYMLLIPLLYMVTNHFVSQLLVTLKPSQCIIMPLKLCFR